jgi:hypothetical protein
MAVGIFYLRGSLWLNRKVTEMLAICCRICEHRILRRALRRQSSRQRRCADDHISRQTSPIMRDTPIQTEEPSEWLARTESCFHDQPLWIHESRAQQLTEANCIQRSECGASRAGDIMLILLSFYDRRGPLSSHAGIFVRGILLVIAASSRASLKFIAALVTVSPMLFCLVNASASRVDSPVTVYLYTIHPVAEHFTIRSPFTIHDSTCALTTHDNSTCGRSDGVVGRHVCYLPIICDSVGAKFSCE